LLSGLGFCCSFGFLLSGLGVCCSFSVGHPILLLLLLLDQHRRLGFLSRSILFLQMGFSYGFDRDGFDRWQCSSPGFDRRDAFDCTVIAWL
jgi:hypothetical protein